MKKLALLLMVLLCCGFAFADYGTVLDYQKISDTQGGFTGVLNNQDYFGNAVSNIGDLDGDGVQDIAVGSYRDDDGGTDRGGVWIVFMNDDGSVKNYQKISDTEGGFFGTLEDSGFFGMDVSRIGDLDDDGVEDIVVGSPGYDGVGTGQGAIWVLFMNSDGTVKDYQKITSNYGSFSVSLNDHDYFGASVTGLGDLDGDDVPDLAVGAYGDDEGGSDKGSVWIFLMNSNGTVKEYKKIGDSSGGFEGNIQSGDWFGMSLSGLLDLNKDGVDDIVVGTNCDDDGGTSRGAVWVLFMNDNGTVKSEQKISDTTGGFGGVLNNEDYFGQAVSKTGDLNSDGTEDIAVGTYHDDDGGVDRGAVWILFLNSDGTVKQQQKISNTMGDFTGGLDNADRFGVSVAGLGDFNDDGNEDIIVGSQGDDDDGSERGAVWILSLNKSYLPLSSNFQTFPSTTNFSQVENLSAVENLTLGSPHGTISFGNNTVNAEGQNYDKNVVFGDCFVAVNASDLDYTFNATAYLLMNNSDGHCGDNTIFVTSQVVADAGAVKTGAKVCTDCKTVTIGGDTVTFRVPHFSSYAIGSNSNITIDANDPKQVNETVTFTAVYRNSSSGDFISGANCQIDLSTGSYAMSEDNEQYIYQTSFEQNNTYGYNVTCSKTGYNALLVGDSFQILPAGEAVPEFNLIGILLLVSVLITAYLLKNFKA